MGMPVLLEQLIQCGVERSRAIELLPQINQWLDQLSAMECWRHLSKSLLKPTDPFALHELLYKITFADEDIHQGYAPAWIPTDEQLQSTHLAQLMEDLNFHSYSELYAWSVRDRLSFWETMIQRLRIQFQKPYTQLVDLLEGVEFPQWFVNTQLNIVESCFGAADDAVAIVFQREGNSLEHWTYKKLQDLTNRMANGLVNLGFQPGDAIAIDLPMMAESVAIYLGIIKAGCVVVSIADSFAPAEIAVRLRIANAKAIFTQDWIYRNGKQLPLYSKVIEANAPRAIVLSRHPSLVIELRLGDLVWKDFLSEKTTFDAVSRLPSAHTNILFSSGTTGEPKAIPWTHTTPIKCASDGYLHHDIHPKDVIAWSTNLGWMMGPWLIYASLINRATIALYEDASTTRGYGQFIQDAHVTMLGVVPSLVSSWKASNCMHGLDWSHIKAFSSTGECSNPQDMLFLMSLAGYKPIVEYCGGTEIGGAYITGTLVQFCIPSTFTTPALGLDFVILDADDRPANKGEGFIIPPAIGLSTELLNKDHHQVYFANTPSLNLQNQTIEPTHSPLSTPHSPPPIPLRRHRDFLERIPNGYYRMGGRVDDTMNLGGIKVSSAEIEQVLHGVTEVRETAAIALSPSEGGPNRLIIYAVLADSNSKSPAELKTLLQQTIAQQLNPLFKIWDLVVVESLPRTASNKVMRRVLRDRYGRTQS